MNDLAPFIGGSGVTADFAKGMATEMVAMNRAVFYDIGWQHEAFLTGGVKTLELLSEYSGQQQIDPVNLAAWQAIATGNEEAIATGNHDLLFREQLTILQPFWDGFDSFFDAGIPIGWMALSPIPNGLSFTSFSGGILAFESIADFNSRWPWLRDDMLPKWLAFSDASRRDMANSPLGSQMGEP